MLTWKHHYFGVNWIGYAVRSAKHCKLYPETQIRLFILPQIKKSGFCHNRDLKK